MAEGQDPAQARCHPGRTRTDLGATGRLHRPARRGRAFFLAALELLRDPKTFYEQGGTSLKRAMNKLVFTKLYVEGEEISGHELAEPVRDLIQAERLVARDAAPSSSAGSARRRLTTPAAPPMRTGLRGLDLPERTCLPWLLRATVQVEPLWWAILGLNQ